MPTDLQSVVFDRFTNPARRRVMVRLPICPQNKFAGQILQSHQAVSSQNPERQASCLVRDFVSCCNFKNGVPAKLVSWGFVEPPVGFEPTTLCLQNRCSNQLS